MSTGSAKDSNYYAETQKFVCIFFQACYTIKFSCHTLQGPIVVLPTNPSHYTHAIPKAFHCHHCGGWYLQTQTGHPALQCMVQRHCQQRLATLIMKVIQFNSGVSHCMSFDNQASRVTVPTPESTHLYFLLSCITQPIICHNKSILMQNPWQLHIISSQNASHTFTMRFLRAYAKAEIPFYRIKFVTPLPLM